MAESDRTKNEPRLLRRLILAEGDMSSALRTTELLVERVKDLDDPLYCPLSCAVVIYYTRPFIGGRNGTKLPGRFSMFESPGMKSLHKHLIEQRNKFDAHRDDDVNKVEIGAKIDELKDSTGRVLGRVNGIPHTTESRVLGLGTFPLILELCEHQIERIRNASDEMKARLCS